MKGRLDMNYDRREYGKGTYLVQSSPWGFFATGSALCSDGKVRKLKRIAETADTFSSVPASVQVGRKTVSGYDTIECLSGSSVSVDESDPEIVKFVAYSYGKNGAMLPGLAYREG